MFSVASILAVTAGGIVKDFSALPELGAFNDGSPVALVQAKKDTKTLSQAAAYALAGFEQLTCDQGDWQKGLFLSAPAPAASDKSGYDRALQAAVGSRLSALGENLDQARPVSGLIGLPNGVMCFAARTTGAFGPNSVAVNEAVGCHQSISTALRHRRAGTLNSAIVAGFAHPRLTSNRSLYAAMGLLSEPNDEPATSGLDLMDSVIIAELTNDEGPVTVLDAFLFQKPEDVLQRLIRVGIDAKEIAIVFLPQLAVAARTSLPNWIQRSFSNAIVMQTANGWGYQAEAAGLVELGILKQLANECPVSDQFYLQGCFEDVKADNAKPFIVFSESVFGQRSCVIGRIQA